MRLSTRAFVSLMAYLGIIGSVFAVMVNGDDPAVIQYIFWPSVFTAVVTWVREVYDAWRGGAK